METYYKTKDSDTMEIHHETRDLDSTIPKIYHQDLEEVSKEKIQKDYQKEVVTQEIIITTQED